MKNFINALVVLAAVVLTHAHDGEGGASNRLKRQDNYGSCTEEEYNSFFQKSDWQQCQRDITLGCTGDCTVKQTYDFLCSDSCLRVYHDLFTSCDQLEFLQVYRAECGKGPDGNRCGTLLSWAGVGGGDPDKEPVSKELQDVVESCPNNANDTEANGCSTACSDSLAAAKAAYGCCYNNFLNDSVVGRSQEKYVYFGGSGGEELSNYEYLASNDLWNACGVDTADVGFCYESTMGETPTTPIATESGMAVKSAAALIAAASLILSLTM